MPRRLSRLDRRIQSRLDGRFARVDEPRSPAVAYVLASLVPVFYAVQQLMTAPRFILGGEMWAEMATNYFANAESPSLKTQLLSTDAGYIPLPQRLIGMLGSYLDLPASAIPYFYTSSAILLTGILLGVIVLPVFRALVPSDWLRFFLAVAALLVVDFETRTYINFTYLAVVPIAFVAALAIVDRGRDVPAWAWLIPVFLVSKPAVLTVVPAIVIAGLLSRGRFRKIAILSVVAAVVQLARLALSARAGGSLLQADADSSILERVWAAVVYTVGFAGKFTFDARTALPPLTILIGGIVVLLGMAAIAVFSRSRAAILVPIGLSLLAFAMLLDALSFANWFTADGAMLGLAGFDRRVIVGVLGVLVTVVGVASAIGDSPRWHRVAENGRLSDSIRLALARHGRRAGSALAVVLFVVWFGAAGWTVYAQRTNQPVNAPNGDVLQWQASAQAIGSAEPVVCVPIAPLGWSTYGRGCSTVYGAVSQDVVFEPVEESVGSAYSAEIPVPEVVTSRKVGALAVVAQPHDVNQPVRATLRLVTASGEVRVLTAEEELPLTGGTLLFSGYPVELTDGVVEARIDFDGPARLGWSVKPGEDEREIKTLWMGQ